jgi:ABC-type phosphate transport system ATPase subunit
VTAFAGENEAGKSNILLALLKLTDEKAHLQSSVLSQKVTKNNMASVKTDRDVPLDRLDELMPTIQDCEFVFAEFELTPEMNEMLQSFSKSYKAYKTNEKLSGFSKSSGTVQKFVISKTYGGKYHTKLLDLFEDKIKDNVLAYIISKIPRFVYFKEVTEIDSRIDLIGLALKLSGESKAKNLTDKQKVFINLLTVLDIWEGNLLKSIASVYEKLTLDNRKEVDFRVIFERIPQFYDRVQRGFAYLNKEFAKWWGKDDTIIACEPYNKGLSIIVIDANGRKFKLENRSTGFRRFFALFLSFSMNQMSDYKNSILLFDEAGAALHPLVQRKLEVFFNSLSHTTQILYNTHTSYMLSVTNLNRVRIVYKDETNHTLISDTLRINKERTNEMSLFPVQSALALYVAEKAFAGCLPIIVLNEWDQFYISLIKNILCAEGKLKTVHETLVFATGENGVDGAAEAFNDEGNLPIVLLPSDEEGKIVKARLVADKYKKSPQKVMELADFGGGLVTFEDLIPSNFVEIFSRLYLAGVLGSKFVYDKKEDLLGQIIKYAKLNKIELPANFRTAMAMRMKINTMKNYQNVNISGSYVRMWQKIWVKMLTTE